MMPGVNGLELLRELEISHPSVARVMLTAYGELPELLAATSTGLAFAVIMKPWDRDDVERIVARAVRMSSMSRSVGRMVARLGTAKG